MFSYAEINWGTVGGVYDERIKQNNSKDCQHQNVFMYTNNIAIS